MTTKADLQRYTRGVLTMGIVANAIFFLLPTECKRPPITEPHAAYELVAAIDAPLNAFPSLHAGFAVLSTLYLGTVMGQSWKRWRVVMWLWVIGILYATLATKQHVLTDLLGGSAVAALAFWLSHWFPVGESQHVITETFDSAPAESDLVENPSESTSLTEREVGSGV